MKAAYISFAFILCLGLVHGKTLSHSLLDYKEGQRYFYFPDVHGNLHLVDALDVGVSPKYTPETDVKLDLYTRQNIQSSQQIVYGDGASLTSTNFDKTKAVKLIAHGWTDDGTGTYSRTLVDAFLGVLDVNVIIVDWGIGAAGLYPAAVLNVGPTGQFMGQVVDWLVGEGVPLANVHLIGHSLGGHVVGIAGRSVTVGPTPFVTSLDPAYPLWGENTQRIRPTDAVYVEVIHSNGGQLGLNDPVGDNDFYPNRGSSQPGCGVLDFGCSHARCWQYYADSLDHTGFQAKQCTDYAEMNSGSCKNLSTSFMGGSKAKPAVGIFYLETNQEKPYYQG